MKRHPTEQEIKMIVDLEDSLRKGYMDFDESTRESVCLYCGAKRPERHIFMHHEDCPVVALNSLRMFFKIENWAIRAAKGERNKMKDISIIIPAKDFKIIERSLKKNEHPISDPTIMNRPYHSSTGQVEVWLTHEYPTGYHMHWQFFSGLSRVAVVDNKQMACTVDDIAAHFEIDPTYE